MSLDVYEFITSMSPHEAINYMRDAEILKRNGRSLTAMQKAVLSCERCVTELVALMNEANDMLKRWDEDGDNYPGGFSASRGRQTDAPHVFVQNARTC